jgi:hypothetical protein
MGMLISKRVVRMGVALLTGLIAAVQGAPRSIGLAQTACTLLPRRVLLPLTSRDGFAPEPGPLANGDFEAGAAVAWQLGSQAGFKVIYATDDPEWLRSIPSVAPPAGGRYTLWFRSCTGRSEQSNAFQTLVVPAAATTLRFSTLALSRESKTGGVCPQNDVARVLVNGEALLSEALCETLDVDGNPTTPQWQERSITVTAYAGQAVTLRFAFDADEQDGSNWLVDNVAFGQ